MLHFRNDFNNQTILERTSGFRAINDLPSAHSDETKFNTNETARVKVVLITWLRKTAVGPLYTVVCGGRRGVQIRRCGYSKSVTAEEKARGPRGLFHT